MFEVQYFLYFVLFLIGGVVIGHVIRTFGLFQKTLALERGFIAFEQNPVSPTSIILIVGDSTAVGSGSRVAEESIAGRFGQLFPTATIVNEGINGQKITELVDTFNRNNLSKVDLLIIQIGANDIVQFTPLKTIEMNLNIIMEKATKISDKIVVLHGGNIGNAPLFPRWLSFLWDNRTKAIRDLYLKDLPKYGVAYVDLYQTRANDIFLTDPQKYYAADLFHPSSDGYKVWFDKIVESLHNKYGKDLLDLQNKNRDHI